MNKCGYESDAMLVRQAHHILSELPEDADQARKVLAYASKLLNFQEKMLGEPLTAQPSFAAGEPAPMRLRVVPGAMCV